MSEDKCIIKLHEPDIDEKLFFFICGAIISIPLTLFIAQFANWFLSSLGMFYSTVLASVVFAPIIEEFSKIFPLFYRHGETERSIFDLALFVGFGFGIVEMAAYVFLQGVNPIVRVPGLLFHPASTSIAAYGIATKRPMPFYLAAVGLHASNNLLALPAFSFLNFSLSGLIVAITATTSLLLRKRTHMRFIE
ncbi:MAG: PrsW family glutamic-type intramembrane protease [Candidatus Bathyarchaeia archaeon]